MRPARFRRPQFCAGATTGSRGISKSDWAGWKPTPLRGDLADLHAGELLAVAGAAAEVFAAAHLLDEELFAFLQGVDDFRGNDGPRDGRLAELDVGAVGDDEDLVEGDRGSAFDAVPQVDLDFLAFFDLI